MDGLREYVISVVTAALICGIVSGLIQSTGAKAIIKLLCGLFLIITIVRPISGVNITSLIEESFPFAEEASAAVAIGEDMAQETMADIIKSESEAYILDKAAALHTELSIEITLDGDNIPVSAKLGGEVSPYTRQRLESILETDLGITKENQLWTG